MTGSLTHRGGTKYKVTVYAGKDMDGVQRQRSRTFQAANLQRARKLADKISTELDTEIREGLARRDTVAGLADEWLQLKRDMGRSPSTIVNYKRQADRVVARFGKLRPSEITGRMIDQWYSDLAAKGMTPANILHHHTALRGMLRQAEKWEMVGKVATRNASPPERIKPTLKLPTTAAVTAMMRSATGDLAAALHILAGTGARRGELVGLQWADIYGTTLTISRSVLTLTGGKLLVKTTKGKRARDVELDPATLAIFAAQLATVTARADVLGVKTPWVFPNFHSDTTGRTPRPPGWLSAEWGKLRTKHGATTCRLHDLRHWHASVLLSAGVSIVEVAARIGHRQTSTTLNVYGHLVPGEKGRAAAAISAELQASS